MSIHDRDPHRAFEDALASGVLTENTIGDYMYMYTDSMKGDAFKNKWTKEYIFNKVRKPVKWTAPSYSHGERPDNAHPYWPFHKR
tara:strand:- start:216 stop:470 length:255 start_codon:yes stop_codon:yes gene_type:complete